MNQEPDDRNQGVGLLQVVFLEERNQLFDSEVGQFEISHGHGRGGSLAEDFLHLLEGSTVGDDVDSFIFVSVFLEISFDVDAPGASGFDVNGHIR